MDTNSNDFNDLKACLMSPLDERLNGSKEITDMICEMSSILKTDLDPESLVICFKLLESGVNPEALAKVVHNLRKQSQTP
ncbi:unnamed protein product [Medioppia subpectinata]|uniref:Mitotic-spindle organizing protein 1 n=1 Tax=Medioppia subpectinata TaxID=1979941 RepID=A0A7R9KRX4_9ACAR|nr:unnamed protein product [Medioppia subpectinata]CAG2108722.1 unnamed protein product [Medioppia subpectinata]